jgi:selenide,water dikinase
MSRLNREAAQAFRQAGAHACTDVTGFALIGHAHELAERGPVRIRLAFEKLPFLSGSFEYAEQSLFPAGTYANQACYRSTVTFDERISEEMQLLLYTPETSGGLLAAVPPGAAGAAVELLETRGVPYWIIGEVVSGSGIEVAHGG